MNLSITLAPSIAVSLEPRNWQECLFFRAIDPTSSHFAQAIHLVALVALGVLFSIVTLGFGALYLPQLVEIYSDYRMRVTEKIEEVTGAVTKIQRAYRHHLLECKELERELQDWVDAAQIGENRVLARQRIVECFRKKSPELRLRCLFLKSLPPQIGKLKHLSSLRLDNNELSSLPDEIGNLVNLKELSLDDNYLESLPAALGNLTKLGALYLGKNALVSLPREIGNLTSLRYLNLSNNMLVSLPREIGHLIELQELDLSKNALTSLPNEIGNLRSWRKIDLDNNELTSLPESILNSQSAPIFSTIYAGNNRFSAEYISFLTPHHHHLRVILNVASQTLPVSRRFQSLLQEQEEKGPEFKALISEFRELEMALETWADAAQRGEDRISAQEEILLCFRQKKSQLTLKHLHLMSLPAEIGKLHHLKELDVCYNSLSFLPPEIGDLVNLRKLDLSDNQLVSIPPQIGNLINLEELNASQNQLRSLPVEIGNLVTLKGLFLTANQLRSLTSGIGNLANLKFLQLNQNQLNSLPSEIGNLVSLKGLRVEKNQLRSLPIEIRHLIGLEFLDLRENQLSSLPSEIETLINLKGLNLKNNQLATLPSEIGNLVSLCSLNVEQNQLTTLPETIFNLPSTTTVYAEDNRFSAETVASLNQYSRRHPQGLTIYCSIYELLREQARRLASTYVRTAQASSAPAPLQKLPEALKLWQDLLPKQEWPNFKVLEAHNYTPQLIIFLNRLVDTKDYKDVKDSESGKRHFAERVMNILCTMVESAEYRELSFWEVETAVNSCGDAITLGFNNLETLRYAYAGNQDKTTLELAVIAIGLIRLSWIKKIALDSHSLDPVETELFLQVKLADVLKLPLQTKRMLYPGVSIFSEDDLPPIIANIKAKTISKKVRIEVLLNQPFWRSRLRSENEETYFSIDTEVSRRKGLNDDEKKGLANELMDKQYKADTEKWYDANEKNLEAALTYQG